MKLPIVTLSISGLMALVFIAFGGAPEPFIWLADTGFAQTWRMLTAHFVHSDFEHLLWNLAAFMVLGTVIERHSTRDLLYGLIVGVVAVNVYLSSVYQLTAYAGLSGVLNTLLVIALFKLCQIPSYRAAAMWTMILSMLKIVVELYSGHSVFSSIAWQAVPQAHLVGWIAGAAFVSIQAMNKFNTEQRKLYKLPIKV